MSRDLHFSTDARAKLAAGVKKIAQAVKVTLGPKGRHVFLERLFNMPHVTKDGVTVAKEIFLQDPVENMGAQMIRNVANQTVDDAGDGTTTATILAEAIFTEGLKMVDTGSNPMDVKRGLEKAMHDVLAYIKDQSREIDMEGEDIKNIATISANGDETIGTIIADAIKKIGKNGLITVEYSKNGETRCETRSGFQIDNGYMNQYFANNQDKMKAEYENPYILVFDGKLSVLQDFLHLLSAATVAEKRPLLIIAENIDGEAMAALVHNRIQNNMQVVCVTSPSFGENRIHAMDDIAALVGTKVISATKGQLLKNAKLADLGTCESISVTQRKTIIIGGKGNKEEIESRISQTKTLIENEQADLAKERLEARLANLLGAAAVMYVGGATEVEIKEKKDRVDDALQATRAAIEEGVVIGGGTMYLRAAHALKTEGENADEVKGIELLKSILKAPFTQIMHNLGKDKEVDAAIDRIKANSSKNFGFNAKTEKFGDLMAEGVIDPAKVQRVCLENAVSVSTLMLITECVVAFNEDYRERAEKSYMSQ